VICLQPFNFPEEKIDMICIAAPGVPTRLLHRGARCTKRKRRRKIPNVEPHLLPVDDFVTQIIGYILGFLPLTKLQPGSPNYIHLGLIGMRFLMKKVLKQIKMGLDPQEGFTQVDKDRDVKDGIRGQVMHLNPPVVKEAMEEVRNRKTEAPKNMRKENNRFVSPLMRKRLPHGSMPMDHSPRLKKMALNQTQKMRVGALTRLPLVDFRLTNGSIVHLPLRSRSLRRHWNVSLTSCPGASGG